MANPEEIYQCQTVNCGYMYNPDKGDRKGKSEKVFISRLGFLNVRLDGRCHYDQQLVDERIV